MTTSALFHCPFFNPNINHQAPLATLPLSSNPPIPLQIHLQRPQQPHRLRSTNTIYQPLFRGGHRRVLSRNRISYYQNQQCHGATSGFRGEC
ncbi:hypothetical protein HanIR_Chr13g0642491 [Helianthus annuus]|nr:hypothetical protein HanIR_Chr13g0642491 [Helianthus annuus]